VIGHYCRHGQRVTREPATPAERALVAESERISKENADRMWLENAPIREARERRGGG
jgi:hypothetical protein